jgi:sugar/nucleoside kinase (ribokinase family)
LALEVALTLGITCASESVTNQGTQSSYPSPARAEEIMQQVLQGFSAP